MPKVLFLNHSGELGGGELTLVDVARHFGTTGHVIMFQHGPLYQRLAEIHVPVTILQADASLLNVNRRGDWASDLASAPALFRLAMKVAAVAREYDVVYANSQKAMVVGAAAAVRSRRPLLWHLHDILAPAHFSRGHIQLVVSLANRVVTRIIANSQSSAEAFIAAGGDASKVQVVPCGIDETPYRAGPQTGLREQLGCGESLLIGTFSRLAAWKGQHVLIAAMQQLKDAHALIVGDALFSEAPYQQRLLTEVAALDTPGQVHFLGFQQEVAPLVLQCDVLVHTSILPEPFGRVLVEGMLAGRPVVATAPGGAAEILRDGIDGWLLPPGDVPALVDALEKLRDPALRRQMGLSGRTRALENYTLSRMLGRIEEIVKKVAPG